MILKLGLVPILSKMPFLTYLIFYVHRLVSYIEEKTPDDGLVVAPDKKKNPWAETRKCEII